MIANRDLKLYCQSDPYRSCAGTVQSCEVLLSYLARQRGEPQGLLWADATESSTTLSVPEPGWSCRPGLVFQPRAISRENQHNISAPQTARAEPRGTSPSAPQRMAWSSAPERIVTPVAIRIRKIVPSSGTLPVARDRLPAARRVHKGAAAAPACRLNPVLQLRAGSAPVGRLISCRATGQNRWAPWTMQVGSLR